MNRCSVCGGDPLFDVEQDEFELMSSPCTCTKDDAIMTISKVDIKDTTGMEQGEAIN